MANDNELADLLQRATRALGEQSVPAAFQRARAIIGPSKFPEGEDVAQQGLDALKQGQVPTPVQIAALEAVIKALRPSLLSQAGLLDGLPPYQKYDPGTVDQWNRFRQTARQYLYSVGRIDKVDGNTTEPMATGFVVAPGVLVTNTHVLDGISANTRRLQKGQAVVLFGQEFGVAPDRPAVAITEVIAVHPDLDMSLLRIEDSGVTPWPIDTQATQKAKRVAAIGYPQDDPRSPVFRDVIFGDRFKVKRGAPGEVRGVAANAVYHDCSTLGGNSGSPLADLDTCQVVGLHRDGPLFLFRNEAVDGVSLAQFVTQNVH
jgi:V8-like Glu-specific endopeptidase